MKDQFLFVAKSSKEKNGILLDTENWGNPDSVKRGHRKSAESRRLPKRKVISIADYVQARRNSGV